MAHWIYQMLEGIEQEKKLTGIRAEITATARKGRMDPDADVAGRLTKLRRQHYTMTGSGGPS